ncbi:MAG: GDP-mannose 4,6-dehydratase [Myxococcales bacterium]|nr:GDP-mannose 4,6-dehydratase [Myxococcales bacterium]
MSEGRRRALITGITGQDGSFLAELLLARGYEVWGLIRKASLFNTQRIDHLYQDPHAKDVRLHLRYGDVTDGASLLRLVQEARPDEVYHLAAQSHVQASFQLPELTAEVTGLGTVRLLEALRQAGLAQQARFYQASTSELFGDAATSPQDEETPIRPCSPYGAAKAYAFHIVRTYREAYGMFAVNGILFNHESERRGETFVTRKITRAVGRIACGLQERLYLGNLDAERDWGFAGDYVEAMALMLQAPEPVDLVIATGQRRSVREFAALAFERVGLDWEEHVEIDPRYLRPAEVNTLVGDASRARELLGWRPRLEFEALVARMVDADLALARREAALRP